MANSTGLCPGSLEKTGGRPECSACSFKIWGFKSALKLCYFLTSFAITVLNAVQTGIHELYDPQRGHPGGT